MKALRNLRVGTRLLINTAVTVALLLVVAGLGFSVASTQQNLAGQVHSSEELVAQAVQIKFQAADFNGWQTAYALDVARGVPDATSDSTGSRKSFLASAAQFDAELTKLDQQHPPADIATQMSAARAAFTQFMSVDQQVIGFYRAGNRTAADNLVNGQEFDLYNQIAKAADQSVALANNQMQADFTALNHAASSARWEILVVSALALALAIAGALLLRATILPAVRTVQRVLQRIQDGDLIARSGIEFRDELGQMAQALDASAAATAALVARVIDSAGLLASASEELTSVSVQMASSAEEASAQAGTVATAAEQVSANVHTVSAAAEEMGSSIHEIAASAADAAKVSQSAAEAAQRTADIVTQLGQSSNEIGNVIKLITAIAEQTNLLALNATIEAARAGEAGKGFAVVASEVKDLAQETAKATTDIADRVQAVQHETEQAVAAITDIAGIISKINNYSSTIAAAVEEQSATTGEMSRSITEAATGVGDIAANVSGVAQAADTTATGAAETQQTAQQLARTASELQQTVSGYRV